MSDCSIKLEVGKKYKARNGTVFGPLYCAYYGIFPFRDSKVNLSWKADGRFDPRAGEHDLDLVSEFVQYATAGRPDPVNNPAHYASGAVECIDAIQASMSVEAFRGYCKGNVQKYVWRYETKGEAESLRKAEWYLKRLLSTFDA